MGPYWEVLNYVRLFLLIIKAGNKNWKYKLFDEPELWDKLSYIESGSGWSCFKAIEDGLNLLLRGI